MINFRETGTILYISSVDISIGNGPGVNEREFTLALYATIKDRAHFLIPKPAREVADLPGNVCTFSIPHRGHQWVLMPFHILSQILLAHRLLSQRRFDLLVFRLDILPFAPCIITRLHNIPYALKTLGQGMINVLGEKLKWVGKGLSKINLWLVKTLLDRAILADSVSVAQVEFVRQVLDTPADKIVWIDNAVNTSRFFPLPTAQARSELGLSGFDPIIGYVGTRAWERGGMQLIESAPRLIQKFPNLGVVILGDGSEIEIMKKKAAELDVADHCIFSGYVPFHLVPLYVNSLEVGVSISLRPDRFAASELKVRQYLACGKPVILSPGSNDFVITETFGSIVPPTDLDAITKALDYWLSLTSEERKEFSERASRYMQSNMSIEAAVTRRFELWSRRIVS